MNLPRRQFLHLAAGAAALPALSSVVWAQAYPTRPVRIVVGFPAGTATDIAARLIGRWLSEHLGQPFCCRRLQLRWTRRHDGDERRDHSGIRTPLALANCRSLNGLTWRAGMPAASKARITPRS